MCMHFIHKAILKYNEWNSFWNSMKVKYFKIIFQCLFTIFLEQIPCVPVY